MRMSRIGALKVVAVAMGLSTAAAIVTDTAEFFSPHDTVFKRTFVVHATGERAVTLWHNIGHNWEIVGPLDFKSLINGVEEVVPHKEEAKYEGDRNSVTFTFDKPMTGKCMVTLKWRKGDHSRLGYNRGFGGSR